MWEFVEPYFTYTAVVSGVFFWIKLVLSEVVRFRTAKKIEDHKYQIEVRKKAELVARLLSHWLTHPEDREELNKMTFECFLWLPDKEAKELGRLLRHKCENEESIFRMINTIRKHLHQGDSRFQGLKDGDVVVFSDVKTTTSQRDN